MEFTTERIWGAFYFDDDKPEEGGVVVQLPTGKDFDEITKECSEKQPPDYRRNRRFEVPDKINTEKQAHMLWDLWVKSWFSNGKDTIICDGKELECNLANKVFMMQNNSVFAGTVARGIEALQTDPKAGDKEVLAKNSESSPQQ